MTYAICMHFHTSGKLAQCLSVCIPYLTSAMPVLLTLVIVSFI